MSQDNMSAATRSRRETTPTSIVAIPVCNEAERVSACLTALANQKGLAPDSFGIVLFLNNCTDGTAEIVRNHPPLPWLMRTIEKTVATPSAGWARRMAMGVASDWLAEHGSRGGVLLTTDADSQVGDDWVARNLAAIAAGADCVAGRIALNVQEAALLPDRLHARGRLEARYEALLTEIDARLDPEPGNPWPCHWSKSGATLAVRQAVYLAVGGMPDMATGEDRAFVDAVRAHDFHVRHVRDIEVITSGRLNGRAAGGVADTIRLRCDDPESYCDDRLEKLHRLLARVAWRRRLRRLHRRGLLCATWRWAPALGIPAAAAKLIATGNKFGAVHAAIETASLKLAYAPTRPKDLPQQIRRAASVLAVLRAFDHWRIAGTAERPPLATSMNLAEQRAPT